MRVSVSFDELSSMMLYANTVLSDKSVEDKMRNIIFLVEGDEVRLVSYNAYIFSRSTFESAEVEDEEGNGSWRFQVKAGEVNKIISSFSSLYKTKVSTIDFEEDGVKVRLTVHEEPKEGEDERLKQDSVFRLENAPIPTKIMDEITMKFPENVDIIPGSDILLYLDSLFPLISNDAANGTSSKISFAEDYVFVINGSMSAFMENRLPDSFKDMSITYSSASFLKKVAEKADTVGLARLERYLCIQEGSTEAFMKFQRVKINYKMYVNKRSKEKGIVIDRLYLKDVLKRMLNTDINGVLQVTDDGDLTVSNSNFNQVIPLNKTKEAGGISFNISIPVLEKAILGRDDVFTGDIFMYFVETSRGYLVFLSDKTGAWFSNTQVVRV